MHCLQQLKGIIFWSKLQSNLSTTATLETEESHWPDCGEVAVSWGVTGGRWKGSPFVSRGYILKGPWGRASEKFVEYSPFPRTFPHIFMTMEQGFCKCSYHVNTSIHETKTVCWWHNSIHCRGSFEYITTGHLMLTERYKGVIKCQPSNQFVFITDVIF